MASKQIVIVLGVAAVAIVGLVVANTVQKKLAQSTAPPAAAPSAGPIVELSADYDEPLKVINFVNKQKGVGRAQALSEVVGKYTPKSGWDGTVTAITNESGGRTALRMSYSASTVIGGEYWVVAIVGKDPGVKQGQALRVHGRIKDVLFQTGPGSVTQSVILDDVQILP